MNIKALYPALITRNVDLAIENMKKLGFEIVHSQRDIFSRGSIGYVMETKNGQRLDVVYTEMEEQDLHAIRVNVDDFEEALPVFQTMGFEIFKGPKTNDASKVVLLKSPDGLFVILMQHLK